MDTQELPLDTLALLTTLEIVGLPARLKTSSTDVVRLQWQLTRNGDGLIDRHLVLTRGWDPARWDGKDKARAYVRKRMLERDNYRPGNKRQVARLLPVRLLSSYRDELDRLIDDRIRLRTALLGHTSGAVRDGVEAIRAGYRLGPLEGDAASVRYWRRMETRLRGDLAVDEEELAQRG